MTEKNYYSYSISAVENGFILTAGYSGPKDLQDDYYPAKQDRFVFSAFKEAVDFMSNTPLVSPPIKN